MSQTNYSGIPAADFIEDVDSYMVDKSSASEQLQTLDELHQKYKAMENSLLVRQKRLKHQIPEISSSLDIIKKLENNEVSSSWFLLCDQVHAKAVVPSGQDKVYLWLGANVMLEYSLEDAKKLLEENKSTASKTLKEIATDLDYLRDQMTITEVSMARLYNWDVRQRTSGNKKE